MSPTLGSVLGALETNVKNGKVYAFYFWHKEVTKLGVSFLAWGTKDSILLKGKILGQNSRDISF